MASKNDLRSLLSTRPAHSQIPKLSMRVYAAASIQKARPIVPGVFSVIRACNYSHAKCLSSFEREVSKQREAAMSSLRIKKEYAEVMKSKEAGLTVTLVGDSMTHWKGTITGPTNTPYEGGVFVVDIQIPKNYPFEPPKMRFDTKVWHPNISSQNGAICLDILKKEWSPALTLRTALLSLQALLSCPNPDDPQDAQVASQYKKDHKAFERTAKHWVESFAQPPVSKEKMVEKLVSMGFTAEQAKQALTKTNYDENAALEQLLAAV
eukprot:g65135.t1